MESPVPAPGEPWSSAATWFAANARGLPWRREPRDPWAVLVSEVMLQQTQVSRVEPAFEAWIARWPRPPALAREAPGQAVRMWAGLGYPRRALRLHAAAAAMTARHEGLVPDDHEQLMALPGIGGYTASAVLAFAYKRRVAVLDTNVRRVLGRYWEGRAFPATAAPTNAERARASDTLPVEPHHAAVASEAVMEIGAVRCGARHPSCHDCPLSSACQWRIAGHPDNQASPGRQQPFAGSDRQVRGRILHLVRERDGLEQPEIDAVWQDDEQRERAQQSLLADGLIEMTDGLIRLPSGSA